VNVAGKDITGNALNRTVTGVAAGAVNASSTDAVNGSQLYATNQNVAANTSDITAIQKKLGDVNTDMSGAVQYDRNEDGSVNYGSLTLGGTAASKPVALHNVAAGDVSATSTDAVNGGQLYGTASSVAEALGGGAAVNADGTISQPNFSVGGTTVHTVADAVSNLDKRTTDNTDSITNIQNQISTGSIGLVQQDATTQLITVGANANGQVISVSGLQGNRKVTGVDKGDVSATSSDAVNGSQLFELQSQVSSMNSQMSNLSSGSAYSNANDVPSSSGAVNNAANPGTGVGSTAVGAGANASGNYATAIGVDSNASADNSVALGQGSVADRANTVSVGSDSQKRQITNVAAGTADTDAVNVGQMNTSVQQGVQQANNYTDQRFAATNQAINDVAKKSYSGSAAAVAMANLPQAPAPGKSIVAVAGGTYSGQSAAAVGLSTFTGNGKWIVKASGSTTTAGTFSVGVGAGYVF
jgi:trimeric autotransporter adhesin